MINIYACRLCLYCTYILNTAFSLGVIGQRVLNLLHIRTFDKHIIHGIKITNVYEEFTKPNVFLSSIYQEKFNIMM